MYFVLILKTCREDACLILTGWAFYACTPLKENHFCPFLLLSEVVISWYWYCVVPPNDFLNFSLINLINILVIDQ